MRGQVHRDHVRRLHWHQRAPGTAAAAREASTLPPLATGCDSHPVSPSRPRVIPQPSALIDALRPEVTLRGSALDGLTSVAAILGGRAAPAALLGDPQPVRIALLLPLPSHLIQPICRRGPRSGCAHHPPSWTRCRTTVEPAAAAWRWRRWRRGSSRRLWSPSADLCLGLRCCRQPSRCSPATPRLTLPGSGGATPRGLRSPMPAAQRSRSSQQRSCPRENFASACPQVPCRLRPLGPSRPGPRRFRWQCLRRRQLPLRQCRRCMQCLAARRIRHRLS